MFKVGDKIETDKGIGTVTEMYDHHILVIFEDGNLEEYDIFDLEIIDQTVL